MSILKNSVLALSASLLLLLGLGSCEEDWVSPIPYVLVDTTVNLSNQKYLPLRLDGGHVDILGGYRGILIYRVNANEYRAFERASPHRTDEPCAYIYVDPSGLFLREGCDNSTYDFEGNPSGGVSQWPLQRYQTALDGNLLRIYNLP
ncbi:MAG: hypothetical protein ACLFOZ_01540 [Cyclobacteriaceae bacterium]